MSKAQILMERLRTEYLVGCSARDSRLFDAAGDLNGAPEILNITKPALVRQMHEEYADAGASLIGTNTTAANRVCLGRCGLASQMREINLAGARLAAAGAGETAWVAGSVGPLGLTIEEDWDLETVSSAYRDQIAALLEGGAHLIQFEFFTNLAELCFALQQAREVGGNDLPLVAQMTFLDNARLDSGEDAAAVVQTLMAAGAAVVGVNCGRSISTTVRAAEALVQALRQHAPDQAGPPAVAAYYNAGYPETADGRLVYMASPAYMAENAMKLAKAGVRLLGGCCGATPETTRAMAFSLNTIRPQPAAVVTRVPVAITTTPVAAVPPFKPGGWLCGVRAGLPLIAEVDPPGHLKVETMLADAQAVTQAGADAISLADNPLASLKMGNIAVAARLHKEFGIHTICHVTCRDRNVLALQSEFMGAHTLGLRAILAITGDPLSRAGGTTRTQGGERSVFELNSFTLVRLLAEMNRGTSHSGADLKGETDFSIGVAFNSAARNLDGELLRLQRKSTEGAQFVMTQPVFDQAHALRVLDLTRTAGLRIFLGFLPLVSARAALYLHNEVPGMRIPDPVLQRLTSLASKEDQEKAGLDMAGALLESLLDHVDGIYLISPHNRARLLIPLVQMVRAHARSTAAAAR